MALSPFAYIAVLLLASFSVLAQDPIQINTKQTLQTVITAGQNKVFTLTIPSEILPSQELYIQASPKIADPFQLPYIAINSTDKYQQNCYNAHSSFSTYCKIESPFLKAGRQFNITVSCLVDCHITLATQLNQELTLSLGEEMKFTTQQDHGLMAVIKVPVSQKESYSSLSISALVTNIQGAIQNVKEGVELFINYGQKAEDPTEQKFMLEGNELYSGGRVAFVDKQKLPSGGELKILLKLKKNINVVLSVAKQQGNTLSLNLGKSYSDLVKSNESKIYKVNSTQIAPQIKDKTVEFVFDIFTGKCTIVIGFDQKFTKTLAINNKYSAMSIEITPEMRLKKNFNNIFYINITAEHDAEFYFYSQITREDAAYMKPYTAYFDQLEKDQLYTYIFDERHITPANLNPKILFRSYAFKVDIASGNGKFLFTRCKSLEIAAGSPVQSLDQCILKADSLNTLSFIEKQIEVKTVVSGSLMTINMEYDIYKCPIVEKRTYEDRRTLEFRQCAFQIIAQSLSNQPWIYSIFAERKYHLSYLKENKMVKEYLPKNTFINYAFSLPSYEDVQEINIFSISFSGKSVLLVSQTEKYPTLQSKSPDIKTDTGSKSSIILKGSQIKGQIYITVFAQTFTEVNVGVLVHRKSQNKTKEITLQNGNSFPYTFGEYEQSVKFKFVVKKPTQVSLNLNQLVGLATMEVLYEDGKNAKCIREGTNRSICRFATQTADQTVYAVVSAVQGKKTQFTISYSDLGRCKVGILNHPTFVELAGQTVECFTFGANRAINLKYIDSINNYMLAQKDVQVQIAINSDNFSTITNNYHYIQVRDMIRVCPLGRKTIKNEFLSTCSIKVRFSSKTQSKKDFNFIVQEVDKQIALFDGITEIATDVFLYSSESQYYFFKIDSVKNIKIFISSEDVNSDFFVIASVVNNDKFVKRNDDQKIYPKFIKPQDRTNKNKNGLFYTDIGRTGTAIISVTSQYLKSLQCYESQCYLLVTVTPDPPQNSESNDNIGQITGYQIEVSQTQTVLEFGDTKTGFLTINNYDSYIISPEDGLVSIRNLQNQDGRNSICARIKGALANGQIVKEQNILGGGYLEFKKSDQIEHIIVKPVQPKCSYQITYSKISAQIHNAKLSQPYSVQLQANQTQAFVYYHNNPVSFKIVKSISVGKLYAYIMPLTSNITLNDALKQSPESYPIVDEGDREHFIDSTHTNFCSNCIYLLVVSAKTRFVGDIVFLRANDPIPLSVNHALKEWLLPTSEWSDETYVFYSVTDFSLTFEVITGKIEIQIKDPNGKILFQEKLSEKKSYLIKAINGQKDVEYYSKKARYEIKAVGVTESEFYIKVDKNKVTERIFEGLPASFNMSNIMPLALQFVNGEQQGLPVSFMVQIKNNSVAELNFTVTVEKSDGKVVTNQTQLVLNKVQAQNTYILTLLSLKGYYYLSISTNVRLNVTILLVRKELTHLSPNRNYFFNNKGVCQIFTDQRKVIMEIFNCGGDLNIIASKNIKDTQNIPNNQTKSIALRRPNYGGHYVLGVQGIFGSYFMAINPKEEYEDLEYLINYNYYDQANPYEMIDVKNYQITYTIENQGYRFKLNLPKVLAGNQKYWQIKSLEVTIYASGSKKDLVRYGKCGIRGKVIEKVVSDPTKDIFLDKSLVQTLNSKEIVENLYFSVQIKADVVSVLQTLSYPVTLLYDAVQISSSSSKKKYWFTDSFFLLVAWLLLPFLLAGAVLYYLLKFCIRKLMSQQANMVEQQIVAESRPTIPTAAKLAEVIQPESAKNMAVNEHI